MDIIQLRSRMSIIKDAILDLSSSKEKDQKATTAVVEVVEELLVSISSIEASCDRISKALERLSTSLHR